METPAPIRLREALELLEGSPVPVPVRFVTYDRRRKTGGEFRTLPAVRLASKKPARAKLVPVPSSEAGTPPQRRPPAHYRHATRNLEDTATGQLVKIHIYLLVEVQGRKVII
ncbi:hypothetical protein HER32_06670 [Hymenobacter sp. BT18]|uniref:hypothetical protein n=1 Tax=Hymenobacter sp. BT18 TaxID=2835648 RepID=UPI00143EDECB|nr:hypothetical protein [Hymenobacter sp. BT18]QIX60876.1 hypothetical protein HER32_06670 [Hymenobacter sp. BT18]